MELGTILVTTAGTATVVGTAARLRTRLRWRRALVEQGWVRVETGRRADGLSPKLRALVEHTRVIRLVLETPLRRFTHAVFGDTPWRRRERCNEYDLALVNARRALWDWLRGVDALEPGDRAVLTSLGLSTEEVRTTLFERGVFDRTDDPWEEVLYPVVPDPSRVSTALRQTMRTLQQFETVLLSHRPEPYR